MSDFDYELERCLLGCIILDNKILGSYAMRDLGAEDFTGLDHKIIYECMCDLRDRRQPIDLITLKDKLRQEGQLARVGEVVYLASLVDAVATTRNADSYMNLIKERSDARRIYGRTY